MDYNRKCKAPTDLILSEDTRSTTSSIIDTEIALLSFIHDSATAKHSMGTRPRRTHVQAPAKGGPHKTDLSESV
ncbi:hypothetical protein NU195Hw_Modified_542t1 [Hortaea werneckii]